MGKSTHIYIVQSDIPEEYEEEFNRIYDENQVKNIYKIPGVLNCERFRLERSSAGMPRYLFVYELESLSVLDSPAWRAGVDAGPWKDVIRPHMVNPRRGVFRRMVSEA